MPSPIIANNAGIAMSLIADAMLVPGVKLEVKDGLIQSSTQKGEWTQAQAQEVAAAYVQLVYAQATANLQGLEGRAKTVVPEMTPEQQVQIVALITDGLLHAKQSPEAITTSLDAMHALQYALPPSIHNQRNLELHALLNDVITTVKKPADSLTTPAHCHQAAINFAQLDNNKEEIIGGFVSKKWAQDSLTNGTAVSIQERAEAFNKLMNGLLDAITRFLLINGVPENNVKDELEVLINAAKNEIKEAQAAAKEQLQAQMQAQALARANAAAAGATPSAASAARSVVTSPRVVPPAASSTLVPPAPPPPSASATVPVEPARS